MSEMERITQLLRRTLHRKTPPRAWIAFTESLPYEDDVDAAQPFDEVARDVVGATFLIRYTDSKGDASERPVTIRSLGYCGGDLAVGGHCHARDAYRVFLARRIVAMINLQTGEAIDNPLDWLTAASAAGPTAEALEKSASGVQILVCLAWCDGHLSEAEWDVILGYIDSNAPSLGVRWDVVEQFVHAVSPSIDSYDRAVSRLRLQGWDGARQIVAAARRLVLADGELTAEESELISRLGSFS